MFSVFFSNSLKLFWITSGEAFGETFINSKLDNDDDFFGEKGFGFGDFDKDFGNGFSGQSTSVKTSTTIINGKKVTKTETTTIDKNGKKTTKVKEECDGKVKEYLLGDKKK